MITNALLVLVAAITLLYADKQARTAGSPMEMVLMGLGGCSSVDVISILEKSRQVVHQCYVEMSATRAETIPAVFTHIHMNFVVEGENIKEALVKRAVGLSAEKYCSVAQMLGKGGVEITRGYTITSI